MDGAGAQWRHLHGYCFICMGEMQTKQLRKKLKKKKKKVKKKVSWAGPNRISKRAPA